jgi:quinol monooxygenase YgiN
MAAYVEASEPNTLTYELFVNTATPTELIIFERYVAESDLTETHNGSDAFKSFSAAATAAGIFVGKSARRFTEQQLGVFGSA